MIYADSNMRSLASAALLGSFVIAGWKSALLLWQASASAHILTLNSSRWIFKGASLINKFLSACYFFSCPVSHIYLFLTLLYIRIRCWWILVCIDFMRTQKDDLIPSVCSGGKSLKTNDSTQGVLPLLEWKSVAWCIVLLAFFFCFRFLPFFKVATAEFKAKQLT